jgi:hypothetical protein
MGFLRFLGFLLVLGLISGPVFADPFVVVTDIDDTLKVTFISSRTKGLLRGIWGTDTFSGISELFQEWYKGAQDIIYLSAALQLIQPGVQETLVYGNGFPPGFFQFNNWLNFSSVGKYKTKELERLRNHWAYTGLPFLFVGDDTQRDPEVYLRYRLSNLNLQKDFPIYIHKVKDRPLPEGVIPYYTALDVALHEVIRNRFTPEQAIRVGKAILNSRREELLIPLGFAACPKELRYLTTGLPEEVQQDYMNQIAEISTELAEVSRQVKDYVESFCKERKLSMQSVVHYQ